MQLFSKVPIYVNHWVVVEVSFRESMKMAEAKVDKNFAVDSNFAGCGYTELFNIAPRTLS